MGFVGIASEVGKKISVVLPSTANYLPTAISANGKPSARQPHRTAFPIIKRLNRGMEFEYDVGNPICASIQTEVLDMLRSVFSMKS